MILAQRSFVKCGVWFKGITHFELCNRVFSSIRVVKQWKKYCEVSKHEKADCEKTAGLRSGNFSDLNSACQEVLVPVKILQFQDMLNESVRMISGHSKRPNSAAF